VPFNHVNEEVIFTGDGSSITINRTFDHYPMIPNTIEINYTSFPDDYTVTDDGEGTLSGESAIGTINYETGEFELSFERDVDQSETMYNGVNQVTGDERAGVTEVTSYFTAQTPVVPGSFIVSFVTGGGNNFFVVPDNGDGTIGKGDGTDGIAISPVSTINYNTGEVNVYFTQKTDDGKDINISYQYAKSSVPDQGNEVKAAYWTEKNLDITEAGAFDDQGNMIAYMTFPPASVGSPEYYVSVQFMIRKEQF
jgi:hypothetical protein